MATHRTRKKAHLLQNPLKSRAVQKPPQTGKDELAETVGKRSEINGIQTWIHSHWPFVLILIATAAIRLSILLVSQTHVHSDEAIIGLMAKHIAEGRHFPFYMYGQPYNAGAAWEAYLAAIAFALFGVSVVSLKGCIVALSLLCLFLFYRMCLALYDQRAAVLATVAFAL